MTNKNELQTQEEQNGEVTLYENNIVEETNDYVVKKMVDPKTGEVKFVRQAKYNEYSSIKAETRAEKLWLFQVYEGDEDSGFGLKNNVGKEIEVQDIILRPYDRINEDTGDKEFGVLTYLITPEKEVYVTSSKTVYFTINRLMQLFGFPHEEDWENIKVKVESEKGQHGDIIKIKMIG